MRKSFVVAALLAATPAFAQEDAAAPDASRKTGLYLRGAAGFGFADSFDQTYSYSPSYLPATPPPTGKRTDIGEGAAWSAAIGFQYARTRTELEYRRFDLDADEVAIQGPLPVTIADAGDVTAQAVMSNIYFDLVNSTRITPYVGAGLGGARIENELGERDAAFAYQARAGVDVALTDGVSLGVEYSYFRTTQIVYGPKEFDPAVPPTAVLSPDLQRLDGDAFAASSVMASVRLVF